MPGGNFNMFQSLLKIGTLQYRMGFVKSEVVGTVVYNLAQNSMLNNLITLLNFYWPSIVDRFILVKSIKNCHYFNISYVVTAAHCFSENNPDNFAVAPESLTLAFG